MVQDKKTLISIIVLLAVFLPMSIYGVINHKPEEKSAIDDNPNKNFIYNNKVYFYDTSGALIGTHSCVTSCGEVSPVIDDSTYKIHYYSLGTKPFDKIINNQYSLFRDEDKIKLYSYDFKDVKMEYETIKTYNIEHTTPIMIVRVDGLYRVISGTDMTFLLGDYDFIGVPSHVRDKVLDTSKFIVKKDEDWKIVDQNNTEKITMSDPIIDFNENYIVVNSLGMEKIYDYNKTEFLTSFLAKTVYCIGEYVVVNINHTLYVYKNLNEPPFATQTISSVYSTLDFEINETKMDVYLDGVLSVSIDLV